MTFSGSRESPVIYARVAGVLMLLSAIGGGLGEAYIPSQIIVAGNAAATAQNVVGHNLMFRLGFATYLIEAICDVGLALVLYLLLRPAGRALALFTALLGAVSTAVFAVAESFYYAPSLLLSGAPYLNVFSQEQLQALALLSLRFYSRTAAIFMGFYGVGMLVRGYLVYRSGFLPRFLGVLLGLGGLSFVVQNVVTVLAPSRSVDFVILPMALAGFVFMLWLLIKGVNVDRWAAMRRASIAGTVE